MDTGFSIRCIGSESSVSPQFSYKKIPCFCLAAIHVQLNRTEKFICQPKPGQQRRRLLLN